jgi:hypothetical protein
MAENPEAVTTGRVEAITRTIVDEQPNALMMVLRGNWDYIPRNLFSFLSLRPNKVVQYPAPVSGVLGNWGQQGPHTAGNGGIKEN